MNPCRVLRVAGLGLLIALAGCDSRRIEKLEEGLSTEGDVRAQFGEPEVVHDEPGGARTLEYPRQPEGQVNYMITIGADGRMSALRQVLKAADFAKVTPGLTQAQVRRLLGRPARVAGYALKEQEVWDWRFLDGTNSKVFSVSFDAAGKVVETATTDEVRVAR